MKNDLGAGHYGNKILTSVITKWPQENCVANLLMRLAVAKTRFAKVCYS